jgi:hypothetical protein
MINQPLLAFQTVAPGQTATTKVPKYKLTLNRVTLTLGGTFTKANISEIEIKIGAKTVWNIKTVGALSAGTILDMINKYRGIFDQAAQLTIDFTERDFENIAAKEVGAYDMSKLAPEDDVFINITIAPAAVAPTLRGTMWLTPPQGKDIEEGQLIQKIIMQPFGFTAGGKQPINLDVKGALIKRMYALFFGAAGSATVEANLNRFEIKKDSQTWHDLTSIENRFVQNEYRKVPQSGMYVVDFCVDNHLSGAMPTRGVAALEINPYFTAADNGALFVEVLDAPSNL